MLIRANDQSTIFGNLFRAAHNESSGSDSRKGASFVLGSYSTLRIENPSVESASSVYLGVRAIVLVVIVVKA